MGRVGGLVKAIEVPAERFVKGSFTEALRERVIDATKDAEEVLVELDRKLRLVSANDDDALTTRFVLYSVKEPKFTDYIMRFGQRLLSQGWTLFLNQDTFYSFVTGGFRDILPPHCREVSIPLQVNGRLKGMRVKVRGDKAVIDVHCMEYAAPELGRSILHSGETVLFIR